MTLFDLFSKRHRFRTLYDKLWAAVDPCLTINVGPEHPDAHRLACFYYASVVYSIFYQSAVAAGMSTSSAFSVTRIQLSKYPFDAGLLKAVDGIFCADAGSRERSFADLLQATIERLVAAEKTGQAVPPAAVAAQLAELETTFAGYEFPVTELCPHPSGAAQP